MMTSRIVTPAEGRRVTAVAWAPAGSDAPLPAGNQRGDAGEVLALRQRIEQLERELSQRVIEARQAGRAEGEAQGGAAATAAFQATMERAAHTLRELTEVGVLLRRGAAADLVELAVAIARRILHRECSVDPCALEGLVRAALEKLDRQEVHRVLVHPSQAASIRHALAAASNRIIDVVETGSVEPGALLFETNRGKLDASIETQLREIHRGLADRVNR